MSEPLEVLKNEAYRVALAKACTIDTEIHFTQKWLEELRVQQIDARRELDNAKAQAQP